MKRFLVTTGQRVAGLLFFFATNGDEAMTAIPENVLAALNTVAEADAAKDAAVATLATRTTEEQAAHEATLAATTDLEARTAARNESYASLLAVLAAEYQD